MAVNEWMYLPSPETNIAMENGPGLKMYCPIKMGIFHCYVSLPECISSPRNETKN